MDIRVNISGNANFFVPYCPRSPDEARRLLRYYEKELEGRKTDEAAASAGLPSGFSGRVPGGTGQREKQRGGGKQMDEDMNVMIVERESLRS